MAIVGDRPQARLDLAHPRQTSSSLVGLEQGLARSDDARPHLALPDLAELNLARSSEVRLGLATLEASKVEPHLWPAIGRGR